MKTLFAALALSTVTAGAQNSDPFTSGEPKREKVEPPGNDVGPVLSICYEDFSLPLEMAAAFQREKLTDKELYKKLVEAAGKDKVRQETFVVARTKSGQQCRTESVSEYSYPSEYNPPGLSDAVTMGITATDADGKKMDLKTDPLPMPGPVAVARTPASPAAFETRNTGFSIECDPIVNENSTAVTMFLVPERVTMVGKNSWGQELSTVEMPTFETQRTSTHATLSLNTPTLIGTMNRPPESKQEADAGKRVWLAFVTVTLGGK